MEFSGFSIRCCNPKRSETKHQKKKQIQAKKKKKKKKKKKAKKKNQKTQPEKKTKKPKQKKKKKNQKKKKKIHQHANPTREHQQNAKTKNTPKTPKHQNQTPKPKKPNKKVRVSCSLKGNRTKRGKQREGSYERQENTLKGRGGEGECGRRKEKKGTQRKFTSATRGRENQEVKTSREENLNGKKKGHIRKRKLEREVLG